MKVIWRPKARDNLREIFDYISEFDQAAAHKLRDRMVDLADRIRDFPHLGRTGRLPGTREGVAHPNYLLIYRVGDDEVEKVAVGAHAPALSVTEVCSPCRA